MQIYIRRNNEDFGPYSREAVLEYVKHGIFSAGDLAGYAGTSDRKTIGELLGIAGSGSGASPAKGRSSSPLAAPKAGRAAVAVRRQPARAPRVFGQTADHKKTHMIFLNLFLAALVAGAAYLRWGGGWEKVHHYFEAIGPVNTAPAVSETEASPTPEPVIAPREVQQPVVEKRAPAPEATPAPEVAASTPPPQKPFAPADIAGNPAAWPKIVKLKAAVVYPAVLDGQVVGSVNHPIGTVLRLTNIDGDKLTLQDSAGVSQEVPWTATDLEEETAIHAAALAGAPAGAAAGAPTAVPVANVIPAHRDQPGVPPFP